MIFNNSQNEIKKLQQELNKRDKQIKELELMRKINKAAAGIVDLNKTLQLIIEEAGSAFEAKIGSIMLLNQDTKELRIKAAIGLDDKIIKDVRIKVGDRISGWVAKNKQPLLVLNVEKDARFSKSNSEKYYTKSLISAPISGSEGFLGVININNKKTRETFTQHDLDLLVAVAEQAGIIINNANNYKELQGLYMDTVSALTEAIDTRDHYTKKHSEHVTGYVIGIANELGLDEERIKNLSDAAKLHDIGKIGVHDYILMKPAKLTPEEWAEIKLHSMKGVKILEPLTFLEGTTNIIKHHHERFDGKGYPDGIKREDIPLEARMMAVADAFDAMVSERPYRKALTLEEAKKELIDNKDTQFDPKVVDAFLKFLKKEKI